jgi:hypothetical protein
VTATGNAIVRLDPTIVVELVDNRIGRSRKSVTSFFVASIRLRLAVRFGDRPDVA